MDSTSTPPPLASSESTPVGDDAAVPSDTKRRRQPRNSACQPCAALKMRCISSADGGKCERCRRMNKECLPPIPKPRKRRGGSETEIQSSTSSLNASAYHQSSRTSFSAPAFRPAVPPSIPNGSPHGQPTASMRVSLASNPDIRSNESSSFASLFSAGLASVTLPNGIDYNYVKSSFHAFRHYEPHFPFISSFSGVDVLSMVEHRPMTTAAICCVTASDTNGWSDHLSHIFRLAVAAKAVVEGERTMDLLIGLLIYTAWHHHHHRAYQHTYQDLCLLSTMAIELDSHSINSRSEVEDGAQKAERYRAFLGCYYLCSRLSRRGFNLPNPFHWTEKLRAYGDNIFHSSKHSADRMLIALIELAHAVETVNDDADNATSTLKHHSSASTAIELLAKSTLQRFKALKREHPFLSSEPAFLAATIQLYRLQLSSTHTSSAPDMPTLIVCACAIKEYLDDILARPASHLHQMSIVDWTDLLDVLAHMTLLAKPLSTTTNSSSNHVGAWESGALSSMLQVDGMLDAVCKLLADVKDDRGFGVRKEGLVRGMREFCERLRRDAAGEPNSVGWGRGSEERYRDRGSRGLGEGVLMEFLQCG